MQVISKKEAAIANERPEGRERREKIIEFIAECEKQGVNPSVREIARNFDIAPGSVMRHIEKLIAAGRLRRTDGHRSLRVVR